VNVFWGAGYRRSMTLPTGVWYAAVALGSSMPELSSAVLATFVLFTLLRTDLSLTDREAYLLLAAYVTSAGWVALEPVGVVGLLPAD